MTRIFCAREGAKKEIKLARTVAFKSGHKVFKGTCSSCGKVLSRPIW